jgi:ATP-dependent RNA helicase DeaD
MNEFERLGLITPILRVIEEHKFEKPSRIQEKAIPLVLKGCDVIAGSATGSGKTLAFGSGIIDNCERHNGIQSLILTPTRELAEQVADALKKFSKYKPLDILAVYGGVAIGPQISRLPHTDIVVGTPGRILDHIQRRTINLGKVKTLVLDEADRMLDMGFILDIKRIIGNCPKKRQTLLFSATISPDITNIAHRYMHNPIEISAESHVDPSKLSQVYYDVPDNMKFSLLVHLLKKEHPGLIMVFCNTQKNTDFVAKNLKANGIDSLAIHGGFSQAKRSKAMEFFHGNKVAVLVCTDVAARGLDIKGVSHVYNYDIPADSKSYVHRIGRTARAGAEGQAISLLSNRDYDNFRNALDNHEFNIKSLELPQIQRVNIKFIERKPFDKKPRFGNKPRFGSNKPRFGNSSRQWGNDKPKAFKSHGRRWGNNQRNDRNHGRHSFKKRF